jgi:hypothetical protein
VTEETVEPLTNISVLALEDKAVLKLGVVRPAVKPIVLLSKRDPEIKPI